MEEDLLEAPIGNHEDSEVYLAGLEFAFSITDRLTVTPGENLIRLVQKFTGAKTLADVSKVTGISASMLSKINTRHVLKDMKPSLKSTLLWSLVKASKKHHAVLEQSEFKCDMFLKADLKSKYAQNLACALDIDQNSVLAPSQILDALCQTTGASNNAQIAKLTGLSNPTVKALYDGKPLSGLQKASILWAIVLHGSPHPTTA